MSDLASELEQIKEQYGRLTPKLVLTEARDENHPLHDRFEWDDTVAGELYRIEQARHLIKSVQVRFTEKGVDHSVRRFYAIRAADADEYQYDDIEDIMHDQFRRKLLLNEMQRRVDELVQQYGALKEFWDYLKRQERSKRNTG